MVDHDWMSSEQPGWTDRSIHPDTSANYANEYDLNVKGWLLQGDNYKAGVTAGYQETRFSWTARGGSIFMIMVGILVIFLMACAA